MGFQGWIGVAFLWVIFDFGLLAVGLEVPSIVGLVFVGFYLTGVWITVCCQVSSSEFNASKHRNEES